VVHRMQDYINRQDEPYFKPWHVARHILGLYQGQTGGRIWRRYLSQHGTGKNPDPNLLMNALEQVDAAQQQQQEFEAQKVAKTTNQVS